MRNGMTTASTTAAVVLVVALLSACGGGSGDRAASRPAARPVAASICGPVTYGGKGRPQVLIVNSGPLQGPMSDHGIQNAQALKLVLAQRGWRAGKLTVGVQVCDEASAASPLPSPAKCARNAKAFAADPSVVVVVGPVSSTCAAAMLPILNGARDGSLPVISMSNTYLGLTRAGPGVVKGHPDEFYPTGEHSFVRMAPADDLQGAASALYAQRLGVRRPYLLHHDETWGIGVATAFGTAATRLGMDVAGMEQWDRRAHDYKRLAQRVRRARADAVYLAGYAIADNGARLIKDLRATLGPGVPILSPDGFNEPAALVEGAGAGAEGVVITIAAIPMQGLPPAGQRFAREFRRRFGALPCCYSVYTAQATHAVLDAIASSDGSRAGVLRGLFRTRVRGGLLGDFAIDRYGDTTLTEIAVYRVHGARLRLVTTIKPSADLLDRR
jgi:branched-chain amino acid transport system substrate-binding protein